MQSIRGQYEKCSNGIKCGSILNWLGVESYPVYDNLSISKDDKKDPNKLLDAFKCYFKYSMRGTFSSLGMHWVPFIVVPSKPNLSSTISSTVWLMIVTLQIKMK